MSKLMDKLFLNALLSTDKNLQVDKRHMHTFYNGLSNNEIPQTVINTRSKNLHLLSYNNELLLKIEFINNTLKLYMSGKTNYFSYLLCFVSQCFENLSDKECCVFTTNKKHIHQFFEGVFKKINDNNIKILFSETTDFKGLLNYLLDGEIIYNESYYNKLLNNLKQLEHKNWSYYKQEMYSQNEEDLYNKHIDDVTSMELPDDWINIFENSESTKDIIASTPSDGLILSLNNLGKVDIEYIAKITGLEYKTVIKSLKGSIYQNPSTWNECFYKGWETADEYLSGKVIDKLMIAIKANEKYKGYFNDNVEALKKLRFEIIQDDEIYITLGSPWIPSDVISKFISDCFLGFSRDMLKYPSQFVAYDPTSGIWEINKEVKKNPSHKNLYTYSINRKTSLDLLEMTLNNKVPIVYEPNPNDIEKRIINQEETLLAKEKQNKLIEEFREWLSRNENFKQRVIELYKEKFCSDVSRKYNGEFLLLKDTNTNIELFDYQKNAVARILFSPNTLLAHDVGSGKTYVMIAAGMEKKRLGISNKNLYVVPNSLVPQWEEAFKELYPHSNILVVSHKNFTPDNKQNILLKIKEEDYDGIIIAYSCFEQIPISKQYYIDQVNDEIKEIRERVKILNNNSEQYYRKIKKLNELKIKLNNIQESKLLYFDELGINTMFLDEAHNYKNLPIETNNPYVLGISLSGSKKCIDMYNKVKIVQKQNNGGGVVFATATPITNSLTDIYVIQKYLQEGQLKLLNLQSFDSWISMFAEKEENFEIDVDTNNYRITSRYSKFHNMQEFSSLLSFITDFHQVDKKKDLPDFEGYSDVIIQRSLLFKDYLNQIYERAKLIRSGKVKQKDDNMLKITTDGRKAALDLRLINTSYPFSMESKVYLCAKQVAEVYKSNTIDKSTQLIFCDSSTPKKTFNIYDEMKKLLMSFGISEKEIAFIHDATTDTKKKQLFSKVQNGEIRVLIGSSFKLGLGVNVQNKLIAIHHLDIPWRPSDMIQREGRMLRKGNENEKVKIYRYITEGSFDAYSWQLLETKQKMIRDILSGSMTVKMCDELNDTVLNYAEVKALAIGNPLLKERVEIINELQKNILLQKKYKENRQILELELYRLPKQIETIKNQIVNNKEDYITYLNDTYEFSIDDRNILNHLISDSIKQSSDYDIPNNIYNYKGFDIIVPNNLLFNKNIIYLKRKETYQVSVGINENKMLDKIDEYLNNLEEQILLKQNDLCLLEQRQRDLKIELSKENDYIDKIKKLKEQLKENSIKLGVKNNECINF